MHRFPLDGWCDSRLARRRTTSTLRGSYLLRRRLLTITVALAGALALAVPANAASFPLATSLQMNEGPGATTAVDSSGNGLSGIVGSHVQTGVALTGGGTGYRFPYLRPNTPPADPEHLAEKPARVPRPSTPGRGRVERLGLGRFGGRAAGARGRSRPVGPQPAAQE